MTVQAGRFCRSDRCRIVADWSSNSNRLTPAAGRFRANQDRFSKITLATTCSGGPGWPQSELIHERPRGRELSNRRNILSLCTFARVDSYRRLTCPCRRFDLRRALPLAQQKARPSCENRACISIEDGLAESTCLPGSAGRGRRCRRSSGRFAERLLAVTRAGLHQRGTHY